MLWDVGVIAKFILNLILVPIPSIGINGAAISSVVCHLIAFMISIVALKKTINLKLGVRRFVIKPILATTVMGICSYFIYSSLLGIITQSLATIIAIISAIVIYILMVVVLHVFSKQEIKMLPAGNTMCKILEKLKIY